MRKGVLTNQDEFNILLKDALCENAYLLRDAGKTQVSDAVKKMLEGLSCSPDAAFEVGSCIVLIEVDERRKTASGAETGAPPHAFKAHAWNANALQKAFAGRTVISIEIVNHPRAVIYMKQIDAHPLSDYPPIHKYFIGNSEQGGLVGESGARLLKDLIKFLRVVLASHT